MVPEVEIGAQQLLEICIPWLTMKLFALIVYKKTVENNQVVLLKGAYDLASFGFFQRNSVQEFMIFTGKIVTERSPCPSRNSVREQDYMVHVYVRADGLSGAVLSDSEYPQRVAHTLLTRVLDEFAEKVPDFQRMSIGTDPSSVNFSGLEGWLSKYQNPNQADAMSRIQNDLDETKVVLHDTIEKVLQRGEKLDDLVEKSEGLSSQSKMFYKSAKKMNRCCTWV